MVGPAGGTADAPNGAVILTIPAGALPAATTFTFTLQTQLPGTLDGESPVSGVWDVKAASAAAPVTHFSKPVRISMLFSGPAAARIYFWSGKTWKALPSAGGSAQSYLAATTDHLTIFAAFVPVAALNPPQPAPAGPPFYLLGLVIIAIGVGLAALAIVYPRSQAAAEPPPPPPPPSRPRPRPRKKTRA